MMNKKHYYRLSPLCLIMSSIVTILLIAIAVIFLVQGGVLETITSIVIFISLTVGLAFMPLYIEEQEDAYKLRLVAFSKVLPKSDYRVREIEPTKLKGSVRTFGSGGVFGFTGHFVNKYLGHYQAYIADERAPLLLFSNDRKKLVINAPKLK